MFERLGAVPLKNFSRVRLGDLRTSPPFKAEHFSSPDWTPGSAPLHDEDESVSVPGGTSVSEETLVDEEIPVDGDTSGQVVASEEIADPREALNYVPEELQCQELHGGNFQEYARCLYAIGGVTVYSPGHLQDIADSFLSEWNAGKWDPALKYMAVEYPVGSDEVIPDLPSGLSWVETMDADGRRLLSIWRTIDIPPAGGGVSSTGGEGGITPENVIQPGGGGATTTTDSVTGETTTMTQVTDPATEEATTTTTVTDPATGQTTTTTTGSTGETTTTTTVTDPATGQTTTTITGSTGETAVTTGPTGETTTAPGATGGTMLPDGRTVLPGGGIQTPDGTIYLPGGGVIYPNGQTVPSSGWTVLPGGGTLLPGGGIVLPSGQKVLPGGGGVMAEPLPATSIAEKLSGVATVGALGVVALAVAGVLTAK